MKTRGGKIGGYFKSSNDAARKHYGGGRVSHTDEWNQTVKYLQDEGVEVSFEGNAMVYGVISGGGRAGNLRIDLNASISALRHEVYHYERDKARNFPGARFYFESYAERWRSEFWAYMVELKFARQLRNHALAKEIVAEMREIRQALREFYLWNS